MLDQSRFAPPLSPDDGPPAESTPPTRAQVEAVARDIAIQLGASRPEALSCLGAKLSDAKEWLPVSGPDDARIWLVIIRAAVGVPRPYGGVQKAQRLEIAIDAVTGKALGFRIAT